MFVLVNIAVLLAFLLIIIRAVLGPGFYDRMLAMNTAGSVVILFIAVFGFLTGRPEFLDIALLYALVNCIASITVLKLFKGQGRSKSLSRTDGGEA